MGRSPATPVSTEHTMPTRPPVSFGSTWHCVGERRRYGTVRALWTPDAALAGYSLCYRALRDRLVAAMYSWTDLDGRGSLTPCFWVSDAEVDAPALQAAVDEAIARDAAARAERARIEEERVAREIAETAPRAAPIRAELARLVEERPWALGRSLTEARELLAMEDWLARGLRDAERWIANAAANVERAAARLNRPAPQVWFAKATDPEIRAAALQACQVLSARDEDWAAVRNSSGWSQATCWTGHVLSERESLDQGEAAHALALLHGHRRQLPDELALILFGETFGRRRRVEPEDAPSLGL